MPFILVCYALCAGFELDGIYFDLHVGDYLISSALHLTLNFYNLEKLWSGGESCYLIRGFKNISPSIQ